MPLSAAWTYSNPQCCICNRQITFCHFVSSRGFSQSATMIVILVMAPTKGIPGNITVRRLVDSDIGCGSPNSSGPRAGALVRLYFGIRIRPILEVTAEAASHRALCLTTPDRQ